MFGTLPVAIEIAAVLWTFLGSFIGSYAVFHRMRFARCWAVLTLCVVSLYFLSLWNVPTLRSWGRGIAGIVPLCLLTFGLSAVILWRGSPALNSLYALFDEGAAKQDESP